MGVAIDLSTAGIRIGYAYEATSGTRPTSGYTNLPNPKSIPDMNPQPNALDITSLNDTEWKRYMEGLKDMGGSLEFCIFFQVLFLLGIGSEIYGFW